MLDKHLWRDFVGVTASVAVLGIGVGSTLPLTALVLNARGVGPEVIGWMVAASALGGIVGTVGAPAVTLKFGRRRVMFTCVALASVSVVALQYTDLLWGWAAMRALFGAAMSPLFVLGEAWINTLPSDAVRGRVVAIYTTSFSLCQVMGPLLTGLLARDPHHAFLACGAVFLLGLPGIALARDTPLDSRDTPLDSHSTPRAPRIARRNGTPADKNPDASWGTILRSAPAIVVGAGLFASFDNVMLSFLPLFALDHGLPRSRALSSLVAVFLGDATLQFAAGYLADRHGRARIHRIGAACLCALLPLMPLLIAIPGLWELYLYVLGGIAGSVYTLSMVSSGELYTGAALLRASGMIALTWNISSSVGPAATGMVMQHMGVWAMPAVLWIMALGFLWTTRSPSARFAKSG